MPRASPRLLIVGGSLALGASLLAAPAPEADLLRGNYQQVLASTADPASNDATATRLRLEALLAVGRYAEAGSLARESLRRFPSDAAAQFAMYRALHAIGARATATDALVAAARSQPGEYDPARETPAAAAARALALRLLGGDPKLMLDRILGAAVKKSPGAREPALALAGIALLEHDRQLAAETLLAAATHFPGDADIEFGLAQAFEDPRIVDRHLDAALKANPRHGDALVFKARRLTDAGDFAGAGAALGAALAVDPTSPAAWAGRAVLANLHGDAPAAAAARDKALAPWPENPEVDFAIGSALARRYRFEEAIPFLRAALASDPDHLPSRFELGMDLLRFADGGNEREGWEHIARVQARDPYHVAAFNLMALREVMDKMPTLSGSGVHLRLAPGDAAIFGRHALDLCIRARSTLSEKYGTALPFDVTVEMLPTPSDFAVRTFSLPGGEGFLGVCFGPLITACSPGGRIGRANWEAVLWHEMTHTVTLTATRHRIPRWLSEGISVHEESQANPGWGMAMNSTRRAAILDGKFARVGALDAAFGQDISLAYFQSGLIVDFLVARYGIDGLKRILVSLRRDHPIADALAAVAGSPAKFEADFTAYARRLAENYGPTLDWTPLADAEFARFQAAPDDFLAREPLRYFAAMQSAHDLAKAGRWADVKARLDPLLAAEPANREDDNPSDLLARAERALGHPEAERAALDQRLRLDAGALPAAERRLDIAVKSGDVPDTARAAAMVLAIDPANPDALLALGRGEIRRGDLAAGVDHYEALLSTDPIEAPRLRLELARALHARHDPRARRQVLLALAENPRLAPALALLQAIHRASPAP